MAITRTTIKNTKKQKKFRFSSGFTVTVTKKVKNSINRIKLPKCQKSYKDPSKDPLKYLPFIPVGLYYLINKYNTNTDTTDVTVSMSIIKFYSAHQKLILPRTFFKNTSSTIHFILLLFTPFGCHSNVITIDKHNNNIHLFEPAPFIVEYRVLDKLKEYTEFSNFTTSYSNNNCKLQRFNFQSRFKVERGYCFAWCIFFIETMLLNKTNTPNSINEKIADLLMCTNTLQYIRGYSNNYYKNTIKQLNINITDFPKIKGNFITNYKQVLTKINTKLKDPFVIFVQ